MLQTKFGFCLYSFWWMPDAPAGFGRRGNMKTVDARGLSCPEPVIQTKNAMASGEAAYEVLVDNVVAKKNVSRFAVHQGYQVDVKEQGEDFLLKSKFFLWHLCKILGRGYCSGI